VTLHGPGGQARLTQDLLELPRAWAVVVPMVVVVMMVMGMVGMRLMGPRRVWPRGAGDRRTRLHPTPCGPKGKECYRSLICAEAGEG
jgi:hypothetical protein